MIYSPNVEAIKMLRKVRAWRSGKKVNITIPGVERNEKFVKVPASIVWGEPNKQKVTHASESEE